MQYFNSSVNEVEFIKDILRTNYVPTIRVFNSDIAVQPNYTVSAVQEGKFSSPMFTGNTTSANQSFFSGETLIFDTNVCINVSSSIDTNNKSNLKYVSSYRFGEWNKNITTNYITNKSYYDSTLHENLGRYLRAYRDFYKIDVLNLYNCFSNRFITSWSLPFRGYTSSESLSPYNEYDEKYKLTLFPILYDTPYQVMFSGQVLGKITLQAVYFNGKVPIGPAETNRDGTPITYTVDSTETFCFRIGSANNVTGSNSSDTIRNRLTKQGLLYIMMQYPTNVDGQIVVLEQPKYTIALNNELLDISPYSNKQMAYSDTLIEYLSGSVLSPASTARLSIENIQKKVRSSDFLNEFGVGGERCIGADIINYKFMDGIFDEGLHKILYKALFNYGNSGVIHNVGNNQLIPNFMGYVDKNVESILNSL